MIFCAAVLLPSCQSAIRFSSLTGSGSATSMASRSSASFKSYAKSPQTHSSPEQRGFSLSSGKQGLKESSLLESAERWLGTPYQYGNNTRRGTDCSGFVMRVYEENGITVPRSTKDQFLSGQAIETNELRVGDLLFFNTNGLGVSHVGMYAGNDTVIHASSKSGVVKQSFSDTYLSKTYIGARRILGAGGD